MWTVTIHYPQHYQVYCPHCGDSSIYCLPTYTMTWLYCHHCRSVTGVHAAQGWYTKTELPCGEEITRETMTTFLRAREWIDQTDTIFGTPRYFRLAVMAIKFNGQAAALKIYDGQKRFLSFNTCQEEAYESCCTECQRLLESDPK